MTDLIAPICSDTDSDPFVPRLIILLTFQTPGKIENILRIAAESAREDSQTPVPGANSPLLAAETAHSVFSRFSSLRAPSSMPVIA